MEHNLYFWPTESSCCIGSDPSSNDDDDDVYYRLERVCAHDAQHPTVLTSPVIMWLMFILTKSPQPVTNNCLIHHVHSDKRYTTLALPVTLQRALFPPFSFGFSFCLLLEKARKAQA